VDETDQKLAELIEQFHGVQTWIIGKETIEMKGGVAQGSVLSPILFNIYLEEALKSSRLIQ
jgi:retron-type reverse transcriptase